MPGLSRSHEQIDFLPRSSCGRPHRTNRFVEKKLQSCQIQIIKAKSFMRRLSIVALLLLSLLFLGQGKLMAFSCGKQVTVSEDSNSGCKKGCCQDTSCCHAERAKPVTPLHASNTHLPVPISDLGHLPSSQLLLILPEAPGFTHVHSASSLRYAPSPLAMACVRLI